MFVTNKTEDLKVHEEIFNKDIQLDISKDEMPESYNQITNFSDKIILDQKLYENGVKTFLAIN